MSTYSIQCHKCSKYAKNWFFTDGYGVQFICSKCANIAVVVGGDK